MSWYSETYLNSDHWQKTRQAVLIQRRAICQYCGNKDIPPLTYDNYTGEPLWFIKREDHNSLKDVSPHIQVHHKYYQKDGEAILYKETPEDLLVLCDMCHKDMHIVGEEYMGHIMTGKELEYYSKPYVG